MATLGSDLKVERVSPAIALNEQRLVVLGSACIATLSFAWHSLSVLSGGHDWLVHRLPDDAHYYLEIGRRIAAGEGSTFDGKHPTNGFHPLWQLIVALLALGFDGWDLARASMIVNLCLLYGAVGLLVTLLMRVIGLAAAATAGALTVALTGAHACDGMESALCAFALCLTLVTLARVDASRSLRGAASLGAAAGLLVLSRLDFALPLGLLAPALLLRWRGDFIRLGALALLAGTVVVLPYLVWNYVSFAHLMPVSGTLKQHFIARWSERAFGGRFSSGYLRFIAEEWLGYPRALLRTTLGSAPLERVSRAVLGILALVGFVRAAPTLWRERRRLVESAPRFAVALGCAAIFLKACADVALSPMWASTWYSFPQRVAAAFGVSAFAHSGCAFLLARTPWPWAMASGALPVVLLVTVVTALKFEALPPFRDREHDWQFQNAETAEWIKRSGSPGKYGCPDAGLLGFELHGTGRELINLDGLVNDFDYATLVENGTAPLERYRSRGVRFYVARRDPRDTSSVPRCAREVWHSPGDVYFDNVTFQFQPAIEAHAMPIRIWDLASCP